MKVLFVNKFLFLNGGSEACMFDTAALLEAHGHEVAFLAMSHHRNLPCSSPVYLISEVDFNRARDGVSMFRAAKRMLYSGEARKLMAEVIAREKPDLVHLHNIYHQISPSILAPLRRACIPSVMTLHDYKMVCPVYTLFRRGRPCEDCRHRRYIWCLLHRCCRGSVVASALQTTEMYFHHSVLDAYRGIGVLVSPSRFLAAKLAELGFVDGVVVLPNFVDTDSLRPHADAHADLVVYCGRLTHEKGVDTLLAAMKNLPARCLVIGDGPQRQQLETSATELGVANVRFLGQLPFAEVVENVRRAAVVVVPSIWYENAPRVVLEAFALGKPVIGARIGGIPELVLDNQTGLTFSPHDSGELSRTLLSLLGDREKAAEMSRRARAMVQREHSPQAHYPRLMEVYRQAAEAI